MKISLITTILNEEFNVLNFLNSVKNQTKLPDEFVIVDGGSCDKTVTIIEKFAKNNKELKIKLIKGKKLNISQGRNLAIKNSANDLILVCDAGCILDALWIQNILDIYFKTRKDIVGGIYLSQENKYFQKCMAKILVPTKAEITAKGRIPSSRSVAFTRKIYEKSGMYPENLKFAEDTFLMKKMLENGAEMVWSEEAIVYWKQRDSITDFAKQIYNYAKWHKIARLYSKSYLRANLNVTLLICSLVISKFFSLTWILTFLVSMLLLRKRMTINEIELLPGVILLRILQEFSIFYGYLSALFTNKTYKSYE